MSRRLSPLRQMTRTAVHLLAAIGSYTILVLLLGCRAASASTPRMTPAPPASSTTTPAVLGLVTVCVLALGAWARWSRGDRSRHWD